MDAKTRGSIEMTSAMTISGTIGWFVDAFTRTPFEGNPAGVVLAADGLGDAQMQAIARELNNSETAFVLAPRNGDHDVVVRFFTPTIEVPVCGHATIAAHYVRAIEGLAKGGITHQLTGVGVQGGAE